ncbi:hypothetical protein CYMTET_26573 [Cymbomonas tetramitiformis]|uniref:Uncharacterized protein n=1 Tax=Cymbomonas tetramitiformis TaxID=36881 RepID=A0AAE0FRL3_9CHLO|nr:hypothetical protein CYMTET_26573 [Cymbomonas tetramitiformis]
MQKSTASITLLSMWLTVVIYFCFPHAKATGHFEDSEAKAEVNEDEPLENKVNAFSGDVVDAVARRARAAVVGAFVADAATMPLHWLYDTDEIVELLKKKSKMASPEFYQPPSSPFYKYKQGALSPYGDEALPLLRSVVKHGEVDPSALADDLFASFKTYKGRLNHASKGFMLNMEKGRRWPHCGVDDDQAHSLVKVAIVVARYAGKPEMLEKMEQAIRVHQDNELAVEMGLAAAQVLERIVLGSTIAEALEWATSNARGAGARSAIREAVTMRSQPTLDAVGMFGKSCHLPVGMAPMELPRVQHGG